MGAARERADGDGVGPHLGQVDGEAAVDDVGALVAERAAPGEGRDEGGGADGLHQVRLGVEVGRHEVLARVHLWSGLEVRKETDLMMPEIFSRVQDPTRPRPQA